MKTILFLLAFLFTVIVALCQPPEDGSIIYNPALDKFIGTWKGVDSSGGELTIKLKKAMYQWSRYKEETLIGVRKYVKNGQVIEDQTAMFNNIIDTMKQAPIIIKRPRPSEPDSNYLRGYFNDFQHHRTDILEFNYTIGFPVSMQWHLAIQQGAYSIVVGEPDIDFTITLPREVTLFKQP